jgi:hypothetical protein
MTPTAITPAGRATSPRAPTGRAASPRAPTGRVASAGTAAGRGATATAAAGQAATSPPRPSGHRSKLRRETAPRAPRRVSGPLGPLTRGRAVPATPRRADPAPAGPRRAAAPAAGRSLAGRAVAFVRSLPDHSLLDRIVRGRAWIPLLGVLLAGIVGMQVEVLKLGASMGRSLERTTELQSRNEQLQASVAALADDQRIERMAAGLGMVMAAPDAVNFLAAPRVAGTANAAVSIHAPDASTFLAQLPADTTAGSATETTTPVLADSSGASTGSPGDSVATDSTSVAAPSGDGADSSTGG